MITCWKASLHHQSYYPCDFSSRDPVVDNKDIKEQGYSSHDENDDDDEEDDGDNELLSLRLLLLGPCRRQ